MEEVAATHERLLVVGSGMAGLSAALWCARLGVPPLVLEGAPAGGVMTTATVVEDYPGLPAGTDGPALAERARAQAAEAGARFLGAELARLAPPRTAVLDDGRAIAADALILALGGRYRRLGVPGEDELLGYGVSHCATCDGFFCHGKPAVVVGGGDTALEDALHLTEHASSVTLLLRGDAPRGAAVLAARVRTHDKITLLARHTLRAIHGERGPGGVTAVTVRDERTGAESRLPCGGLWIAVGRAPATDAVAGAVPLDEDGYVRRPEGWSTATAVPGIFAAGECTDRVYRQAITAAAMGCMAAHDAIRWLATSKGHDVERT